jgi:hypothetical protein
LDYGHVGRVLGPPNSFSSVVGHEISASGTLFPCWHGMLKPPGLRPKRPTVRYSDVSELPLQVRSVSRARLESVMRQALRSSTARMRDWAWEPLLYHAVLPDRALARVSGWALVDDNAPVRWSSVLKLFQPSARTRMGELTSSPREILAYRSSLLAELPGHLRAPRLLGIDEGDDGSFWLWLEDVRDMHGRRWPLAQFGLVARHLGVFNGTYLVSRAVPAEPWLNDWVTRHLAAAGHRDEIESDSDVWAELELSACRPAAERWFGADIAQRTAQLVRDQAYFVGVLVQLPQTLCHNESSLANLFAVDRGHGLVETVAVDWENIGPGPVGAEIATLVFGTMRRCEFDAERAMELDQVVFAAYVDGLREAGWSGPVEHVRLGYTASLALRWSVLVSTLRLLVEGAQPVQTSQGWQVSSKANLRQLVLVCRYMLDRADEARRLLSAS